MANINSKNWITLSNDRDFKRVYTRGRSVAAFCVVLYFNKNFGKGTRVGVTASKRIGNAVLRNRARRVIREAFLDFSRDKNFGDMDIVMVARAKTPFTKSYTVKKCLDGIFKAQSIVFQKNI